ncbi:MAG: gltC 7 [Firmicutes bacterium]|nr:gltC 7 [Bacillota bacterium]
MELWQLREFSILAEHLNFTETAKHLFLTQSVLTRHIAELERELGVQLFTRNKRSVQLTAAGNLLLCEARALLEHHTQLLKKVQLHSSGEAGSIRIGYLDAASKQFLVPFANHFNRVYPQVQLHLFAYEYIPTLMTALQRNEVDISITLSLALPNTSGLNWKPVYSDVTSAVMHYSHPLSSEQVIDAEILADQRFLLLSRDNTPQGFAHTFEVCKSRGFTPNVVQQIPNTITILLMMEMGTGITFLPRHTQIYASPFVRYVDLCGEDCKFDVVIAWKKDMSNPALVPFLTEFENTRHTFIRPTYQTCNNTMPSPTQ